MVVVAEVPLLESNATCLEPQDELPAVVDPLKESILTPVDRDTIGGAASQTTGEVVDSDMKAEEDCDDKPAVEVKVDVAPVASPSLAQDESSVIADPIEQYISMPVNCDNKISEASCQTKDNVDVSMDHSAEQVDTKDVGPIATDALDTDTKTEEVNNDKPVVADAEVPPLESNKTCLEPILPEDESFAIADPLDDYILMPVDCDTIIEAASGKQNADIVDVSMDHSQSFTEIAAEQVKAKDTGTIATDTAAVPVPPADVAYDAGMKAEDDRDDRPAVEVKVEATPEAPPSLAQDEPSVIADPIEQYISMPVDNKIGEVSCQTKDNVDVSMDHSQSFLDHSAVQVDTKDVRPIVTDTVTIAVPDIPNILHFESESKSEDPSGSSAEAPLKPENCHSLLCSEKMEKRKNQSSATNDVFGAPSVPSKRNNDSNHSSYHLQAGNGSPQEKASDPIRTSLPQDENVNLEPSCSATSRPPANDDNKVPDSNSVIAETLSKEDSKRVASEPGTVISEVLPHALSTDGMVDSPSTSKAEQTPCTDAKDKGLLRRSDNVDVAEIEIVASPSLEGRQKDPMQLESATNSSKYQPTTEPQLAAAAVVCPTIVSDAAAVPSYNLASNAVSVMSADIVVSENGGDHKDPHLHNRSSKEGPAVGKTTSSSEQRLSEPSLGDESSKLPMKTRSNVSVPTSAPREELQYETFITESPVERDAPPLQEDASFVNPQPSVLPHEPTISTPQSLQHPKEDTLTVEASMPQSGDTTMSPQTTSPLLTPEIPLTKSSLSATTTTTTNATSSTTTSATNISTAPPAHSPCAVTTDACSLNITNLPTYEKSPPIAVGAGSNSPSKSRSLAGVSIEPNAGGPRSESIHPNDPGTNFLEETHPNLSSDDKDIPLESQRPNAEQLKLLSSPGGIESSNAPLVVPQKQAKEAVEQSAPSIAATSVTTSTVKTKMMSSDTKLASPSNADTRNALCNTGGGLDTADANYPVPSCQETPSNSTTTSAAAATKSSKDPVKSLAVMAAGKTCSKSSTAEPKVICSESVPVSLPEASAAAVVSTTSTKAAVDTGEGKNAGQLEAVPAAATVTTSIIEGVNELAPSATTLQATQARQDEAKGMRCLARSEEFPPPGDVILEKDRENPKKQKKDSHELKTQEEGGHLPRPRVVTNIPKPSEAHQEVSRPADKTEVPNSHSQAPGENVEGDGDDVQILNSPHRPLPKRKAGAIEKASKVANKGLGIGVEKDPVTRKKKIRSQRGQYFISKQGRERWMERGRAKVRALLARGDSVTGDSTMPGKHKESQGRPEEPQARSANPLAVDLNSGDSLPDQTSPEIADHSSIGIPNAGGIPLATSFGCALPPDLPPTLGSSHLSHEQRTPTLAVPPRMGFQALAVSPMEKMEMTTPHRRSMDINGQIALAAAPPPPFETQSLDRHSSAPLEGSSSLPHVAVDLSLNLGSTTTASSLGNGGRLMQHSAGLLGNSNSSSVSTHLSLDFHQHPMPHPVGRRLSSSGSNHMRPGTPAPPPLLRPGGLASPHVPHNTYEPMSHGTTGGAYHPQMSSLGHHHHRPAPGTKPWDASLLGRLVHSSSRSASMSEFGYPSQQLSQIPPHLLDSNSGSNNSSLSLSSSSLLPKTEMETIPSWSGYSGPWFTPGGGVVDNPKSNEAGYPEILQPAHQSPQFTPSEHHPTARPPFDNSRRMVSNIGAEAQALSRVVSNQACQRPNDMRVTEDFDSSAMDANCMADLDERRHWPRQSPLPTPHSHFNLSPGMLPASGAYSVSPNIPLPSRQSTGEDISYMPPLRLDYPLSGSNAEPLLPTHGQIEQSPLQVPVGATGEESLLSAWMRPQGGAVVAQPSSRMSTPQVPSESLQDVFECERPASFVNKVTKLSAPDTTQPAAQMPVAPEPSAISRHSSRPRTTAATTTMPSSINQQCFSFLNTLRNHGYAALLPNDEYRAQSLAEGNMVLDEKGLPDLCPNIDPVVMVPLSQKLYKLLYDVCPRINVVFNFFQKMKNAMPLRVIERVVSGYIYRANLYNAQNNTVTCDPALASVLRCASFLPHEFAPLVFRALEEANMGTDTIKSPSDFGTTQRGAPLHGYSGITHNNFGLSAVSGSAPLQNSPGASGSIRQSETRDIRQGGNASGQLPTSRLTSPSGLPNDRGANNTFENRQGDSAVGQTNSSMLNPANASEPRVPYISGAPYGVTDPMKQAGQSEEDVIECSPLGNGSGYIPKPADQRGRSRKRKKPFNVGQLIRKVSDQGVDVVAEEVSNPPNELPGTSAACNPMQEPAVISNDLPAKEASGIGSSGSSTGVHATTEHQVSGSNPTAQVVVSHAVGLSPQRVATLPKRKREKAPSEKTAKGRKANAHLTVDKRNKQNLTTCMVPAVGKRVLSRDNETNVIVIDDPVQETAILSSSPCMSPAAVHVSEPSIYVGATEDHNQNENTSASQRANIIDTQKTSRMSNQHVDANNRKSSLLHQTSSVLESSTRWGMNPVSRPSDSTEDDSSRLTRENDLGLHSWLLPTQSATRSEGVSEPKALASESLPSGMIRKEVVGVLPSHTTQEPPQTKDSTSRPTDDDRPDNMALHAMPTDHGVKEYTSDISLVESLGNGVDKGLSKQNEKASEAVVVRQALDGGKDSKQQVVSDQDKGNRDLSDEYDIESFLVEEAQYKGSALLSDKSHHGGSSKKADPPADDAEVVKLKTASLGAPLSSLPTLLTQNSGLPPATSQLSDAPLTGMNTESKKTSNTGDSPAMADQNSAKRPMCATTEVVSTTTTATATPIITTPSSKSVGSPKAGAAPVGSLIGSAEAPLKKSDVVSAVAGTSIASVPTAAASMTNLPGEAL